MSKPPKYIAGAKAIGAYRGDVSPAATFHQLERGLVPGSFKDGGRWMLDVELHDATLRARAEAAMAARQVEAA